MTTPQPSKRRRSRRSELTRYAYSGPFVRLLDPIKVLPLTAERYTPDSPESYTVGSQLDAHTGGEIALLVTKPRRKRGRRGGRRGNA